MQRRPSWLITIFAFATYAAPSSTQAIPPRPTAAAQCTVGQPCVYLPLVDKPHRTPYVLYVVPGGAGAKTGEDWGNAQDLQGALTNAIRGAQLWVKAGTYRPTSGTDRTVSFALRSGVAVYGGFAGTETTLIQRNVATTVTTLSGDVGTHGDRSDNSFHVVTGSNIDTTAILDSVTITGGTAVGELASDYSGGGMYIDHGSPTLTNVTIAGNSAHGSGGRDAPGLGGGMSIKNGSPTLTNVTIAGNDASTYGGGMYNDSSNPVLTNVTITGNSVRFFGGGMYNDRSSPVLTNVTINGNGTGFNGGGMYNSGSSPVLTNVTISSNSAQVGGGMYNDSADGDSVIVRNSIVWGNGGGSIKGGGNVQSSDVEGGYTGTGNINADPLFGSPTTGDYHLQAGSPVINVGSNAFVPPGITTDRDGNPRIVGGTVDMGAYEYIAPTTVDSPVVRH